MSESVTLSRFHLSHGQSPLKAVLHDFRSFVKFRIRCLVHGRVIRDTATAFERSPLDRIFAHSSKLAYKPIRPYLIRGLGAKGRLEAIRTHFDTAERLLTPESLVQCHTEEQTIFEQKTANGLMTITLGNPDSLYREAEWRLALNINGRRILEIGVTLVNATLLGLEGGAPCVWIGIVKASIKGDSALEPARKLTKDLEGIRPKSLLLMAAQAMARAFGMTALYGVANEGRVLANYMYMKKRIKADYDQFWEESGGTRASRYAFQLPMTKGQRDISTYKMNKRAQARRRQELENDLNRDLENGFRALMK
jgi:uncharacterized protein VirK/YbjX